MMRLVSLLAIGLALLPALASTPKVQPKTSATQAPALQGDAAWIELERRGEKASLLAALDAARYDARAMEAAPNTVAVDNPAQSIRATFAPDAVRLRAGASAMRLRAIGVGYGDTLQPITHVVTRTTGARVEIDRTSHLTEWWVNRAAGLEQGFTVREAPDGRTDGAWLRVVLEVDGDLTPHVAPDGQSATFAGADGTTRLRYDHLLAVDATGRLLPTRMRTDGALLSLETNDTRAVYPVTIDPTFTAPAYLKASNTGWGDHFGGSVAVSGDTVVVGARYEAGSGTGVNPASDESASSAGAAYVFVRSGTTWSPQAYLKASNTGAADYFGYSVAVSGDTVVVGALLEDGSGTGVNPASNESAIDAGAAYVFVRSGTTWSHQAYLKASNTGVDDQFGSSVAVSGDTVVVGAIWEDGGGTGVNPASNDLADAAGAAYVFVRSGTTWSPQAYLKASNNTAYDLFGYSVAVSGDTVVVGATREDGSGTGVNPASNELATDAGATYVFVRSGTTWSPQAYLKASNIEEHDLFGSSVAVSGDTVVVGAIWEAGSGTGVNPASNESAGGAGAAYVFARSGTTWSPQAYLKASNTGAGDHFGESVAVSGDTVVVAAPWEDGSGTGVNPASNESAIDAGAAYVFVRSGTTWSPPAYLKASNTGETDYFGWSVAVSGDTVVVGAMQEDGSGIGVDPASDETASGAGAAYVFAPTVGLPGAFGKALPIDGATNQSTSPTLSWGASSGAASYDYCLDTTNDSACSAWTTTGTNTSVGLTGLAAGTAHYWHVRATNPGGTTYAEGSSATFWSFTTSASVPGAFAKTTPTNGATNQPMSPVLSWGAASGATSYEYCYDTTNNNACDAGWVSAGASTSASLPGLPSNTTHYWHVRATDGVGTTYADGGATGFWAFTTGVPAPAFGQVDTPAQNAAGVQGAVGVTGWALDDRGVTKVEIFRNCLAFEPANCQGVLGNSVVYIGDAAFLAGARPDVAAAFPTYPQNTRAGWGYLMLTPMLPHVPTSQPFGGQGALTLYVVATDTIGTRTLLGRTFVSGDPGFNTPTSFSMTNDTIAKPFGAIDTPGQGQTIAGLFNNFGWALTPDTNTVADGTDILIPTNGSTMTVFIDGLPVSLVAYNQCRGDVGNPPPGGVYCNDDVANIFGNPTPQAPLTTRTSNPTKFRNLDAARGVIGAYTFDTTSLSDGLHTIAWSVSDSAGRNEGIGSRFFNVLNGAPGAQLEDALRSAPARVLGLGASLDHHAPGTDGVWGRTGFDLATAWTTMRAKDDGTFAVRLPELGRLELWLGAPVDAGYLVAGDTLHPLPVGASLVGAQFGWMPPAGYAGAYTLAFIRGGERITVTVTIVPRPRVIDGTPQIRMHLDPVQIEPRVRGTGYAPSGRTVRVRGWAFDPLAAIGTGIGAVHVWAVRTDVGVQGSRRPGVLGAAPPVFIGTATLDQAQPEVARMFEGAPSHAGFSLTASLAPGTYELTAYAWNERTGRWEDARRVTVAVK